MFFFGEKEFRAVWKIERDGQESYLAGTAHFFPYRFQKSLGYYIQKTRRVLFEGPLDERSMARVIERGLEGGGAEAIYEALDAQTIGRIKRITVSLLNEPRSLSLLLPLGPAKRDPLYHWFKERRPWLAFLQIWSQFLKSEGWKYSVDLEALKVATRLGREVFFLETIEEQVEALEGVPLERMINFLKKVEHWQDYATTHAQFYLQGKVEQMMSLVSEFPTRCPSIVENRDPVFFARMQNFLAEGEVIAFLGVSHMPGIKRMIRNQGYKVEQVRGRDE